MRRSQPLGDMPEHLRTVVAGIFKELDDRAFGPVAAATSLEDANERATKAFDIFASLWPAVLGALIPWMQDNPERFVTMRHVVTDVWSSAEVRRLGDVACGWFAAAQDARVALANAIMEEPLSVARASESTIVDRCIVADFALMFGLFLAHHESVPVVAGLPVTMAKLAYDAAKEAYVLATTARFADPDPLVRCSAQLGAGVDHERAGAAAADDDARQVEARQPLAEIDGQVGGAAQEVGQARAIGVGVTGA